MNTAPEQYQAERSAFVTYLRGQAEWRRGKAEEYPDDDRNMWAATLYEDLAGRIERGDFSGHLAFGAFTLDVETSGVISGGHMDGLDRLGFAGREEPSIEFFDGLLHRVGIAHYSADIENSDELEETYDGGISVSPGYVPDVLEDLGYVEGYDRIVRPLPRIDEIVPAVRDWMATYIKDNPLAVAVEKATELSGRLTEIQTFLDQPKVRKQVAAAADADVKPLVSELAMLSSRATMTVARLANRHPRMKYLG